jgi:hypothetical protein
MPLAADSTWRCGCQAAFGPGKSTSSCRSKITSRALCACASETPRFTRPIADTHHIFPLLNKDPYCGKIRGTRLTGAQISKFEPGSTPVNHAGLTPTTVTGTWFNRIFFPTTEGSRPKRRVQ